MADHKNPYAPPDPDLPTIEQGISARVVSFLICSVMGLLLLTTAGVYAYSEPEYDPNIQYIRVGLALASFALAATVVVGSRRAITIVGLLFFFSLMASVFGLMRA